MVRGNTRRVCGRQVCNDRIAASSPLVRASLVRLTTTRRHRGRGRIFLRFSTDWSRLLSSNFPFFSPSSFIPSFGFYLSRWRNYSFDEERRRTGGGSFDGWVFTSGKFVVRKVIVPPPLNISRVFESGEMIFWQDEVFEVDEFFFLNSRFK